MVHLNDIGVVYQGPTNYCDHILKNLHSDLTYVWSTWDDEPQDNISKISEHMPVITAKKPESTGRYNINLQARSSYNGSNFLDKKWIVKCRGDLLWRGIDEVLLKSFQELEQTGKFAGFLSYKPPIVEIHDFISLSSKENALKLWNFEGVSVGSPENQICNHLCKLLGKDYVDMVEDMVFVNKYLDRENTDLYCIKYDVSLGYQCNVSWGGVEQLPITEHRLENIPGYKGECSYFHNILK